MSLNRKDDLALHEKRMKVFIFLYIYEGDLLRVNTRDLLTTGQDSMNVKNYMYAYSY